MSHAITFDTLAFAKTLENSGVAPKQAEAHTEALVAIFNTSFDVVATKDDIKELAIATKNDIKELEVSLRGDMEKLELTTKSDLSKLSSNFDVKISKVKIEIIKWFIGLWFAQTAIIISMNKLL